MTSTAIDPLVDRDAVLRPLTREDLPTTLAWRNHPESRVWFHTSGIVGTEQHAAWFESYIARSDDLVFILEIDGTPRAQVALYRVRPEEAEFGRLLVDPEARGLGLGRRATELCLRIADETLRLERLVLEVKDDNVRAIRTYEATGFIADGASPDAAGSIVMRRARP